MPDQEHENLLERLEALERQSRRLIAELVRLRSEVLHTRAADATPATTARPKEGHAPEPVAAPAVAPELERTPDAAEDALPERAEAGPKREVVDLEFWLGGRGLLLLGVAALVFAVGFFVKEAIERGWIGPTIRVLLGAGVGVVAVAAGERIRAAGYRTYGLWLAAGGFGAVYLSLWAAAALYALVPTSLGFLLMVAVVAAAAALGLLRDSESFVALAAVGGYLAPLLLKMDPGSNLFGLGYLALLSGTGLWLAYRERWPNLAAVTVLGGTLMALPSSGDPHLHGVYLAGLAGGALLVARFRAWPQLSLLTIVLAWTVLCSGRGRWEITGIILSSYAALLWLVCFIAWARVTGWRSEEAGGEPGARSPARRSLRADIVRAQAALSGPVVTVLPPLLFYVLALVGVWNSGFSESLETIGFVLGLAIGAVYLGEAALGPTGRDAKIQMLHAGLGYAFWLVAPAILFSGVPLARVWLLEGLVIAGAGVQLRSPLARAAGLLALVLAALTYYAVAMDRPVVDQAFVSGWALTGLAAVVGLVVWGLATERVEGPASWESASRPLVLYFAAILFLGWGTVEIQRFFDLLADGGRWDLARDLSISGFWMAYAAGLLVAGFWLDRPAVRWAGLGMALLAAGKVFLYDLSQLSQLYRIVSFVLLAFVFLALSFRYQKLRGDGGKRPS